MCALVHLFLRVRSAHARLCLHSFGGTAAGGVRELNARAALMRERKPTIETKFMRFVFLNTFIETRTQRNITGDISKCLKLSLRIDCDMELTPREYTFLLLE